MTRKHGGQNKAVQQSAGAQSTSDGPLIELIDAAVGCLHEPESVMVEGINWTVRAGDFWAIGGLLGAGKTDFMMMTAGLMRPARGQCRLFGEPSGVGYEYDKQTQRQAVGLVFDGGQLLNHLTIFENVALPIQYHRNCRREDCQEEIERLLVFTNTATLAEKQPGDIGRNWRQRVGLARALVLKPQVLLLDSPLSGLDPRQARWWLETLSALWEGHSILDGQPLTVVVTAHDLHPWRSVAKQFAILKDRRLITMEGEMSPADHAEKLLEEMLRAESEI